MENNRDGMIKKMLESIFKKEVKSITPELVEFYEENPKELDLLINKEDFHIKFLSYFFVFGLVLTVGSRVLSYFFEDIWGKFMNDVILDVSSELGIAIFGGAITAYLLEYLQKNQYQENIEFRDRIKEEIIKKQNKRNNE